uniref:Uncharacterized protein n=1 Tax=Panagrolaimus davidi TaxID=227884 RepID=A0A914QIZ4_9BILA
MKLTVVVLLGLIGVAIALHGTGGYGNGGYGNGGGYGNNGGGGHKHHKSSESESSSSESVEFVKPKVCTLVCTDDAKYNALLNGVSTPTECDQFNTDGDLCYECCGGWALSRGLTLIEYTSTLTDTPKCVCCQRKCT